MAKIKHGFSGQRLIVYPFYVIEQALNNPLVADLVVHSMGYFPKAESHYIDRASGCGEYLLIYCTKGEGWYVLDGKRYVVPENHFFILPAEKPHQYGSSEHDPWYIYWAHFKGKKAKYISDQLQGVIPIDMDDNSRIGDRIAFFDELLNVLESGTDELASHFGYSESYMYRLFFKETGYAPMNYFLHMKIDRACQLLLHTNMKINQVALKLGFDDPYYFSRIFKKIVGTSPKDYRHSLPK